MKYEKNQYSEGISLLGLLLASGFLWWGISGYFPYTIDSFSLYFFFPSSILLYFLFSV